MGAEAEPMASAVMRSTRRINSFAARRENVSNKIRRGSAPSTVSFATIWASVLVLPVPAPATIKSGPAGLPCIESFNGRMRDELLNESLFFGLDHARAAITEWVMDYNTERPHSSLGYAAPRRLLGRLRLWKRSGHSGTAVRPSGETFIVPRNAAGLDWLAE
jgi:transposase InsO family protein